MATPPPAAATSTQQPFSALYELLIHCWWIGADPVPILLAVLGTRLQRRGHLLLADRRRDTVVFGSDTNRERLNQIALAVRRAQVTPES